MTPTKPHPQTVASIRTLTAATIVARKGRVLIVPHAGRAAARQPARIEQGRNK